MSNVRMFDVPHIFRYGMTDEENGETWQLFYRNATVFSVDIKRADIANTPFEREWSKYCVEDMSDVRAHFARWEGLCDLVIAHILPTLKRLAPIDGRQWDTLEDYLKTPRYELKLVKDETTNDAVAQLDDGPTFGEAVYEMQPQPFNALNISQDLPRIAAADVIVIKDENLRVGPEKVRVSATGEVFGLMPAQHSSEAVETGLMSNDSIHSMSILLALLRISEPINIPKPTAVVTSAAPSGEEVKIAGLLHTTIPESAQRLADMNPSTLADAMDQGIATEWRAQVSAMLKVLHSCGIIYDNDCLQYSIWIDRTLGTDTVWMEPPSDLSEIHSSVDDAYKPTSRETDWETVDYTFGQWLAETAEKVMTNEEGSGAEL